MPSTVHVTQDLCVTDSTTSTCTGACVHSMRVTPSLPDSLTTHTLIYDHTYRFRYAFPTFMPIFCAKESTNKKRRDRRSYDLLEDMC